MRQMFMLTQCSLLLLSGVFAAQAGYSQDTTRQYLPEITVVGRNLSRDIHQLPEVVGTSIYAGKKNALVVMDHVKGNVVTNTMRQVVAKVPGIHVWESDGSGIQIGISARGLSPNRSWEFNIRQNGYDIAADPFGYPEAYYNPQLQAVQRIEVVRGQASLQYGPQFGGLVNYILRNGSDIEKPLQVESQQTAGSFGLFNTYNALGGKTQKLNYYAFYDHRRADGWRMNSRYYTHAGFGTVTYHINPALSITAELMQSHIRSQQPGGLTDQDFRNDGRQSWRSRNWMDIRWTTAAVTAQYRFAANGRLSVKLFSIRGDRTSVGYLRPITVRDTLNENIAAFNPRTVDQDRYRNFGLEARMIRDFHGGQRYHTFSAGLRLYAGKTFRFREGKGTAEQGYSARLTDPLWPRDYDFSSRNAAFFAEQLFRLSEKWSVVPGFRYEWLMGRASGVSGFTTAGLPLPLQPQQRQRGLLLAGLGLEWHVLPDREFYANISQAYRPLLFADITTPPTTDVVDPGIRDARGYNIDWGYRGHYKKRIYFDVSVFLLKYNQRVGVLTQQRADGSFYNYRTNVGNSTSRGVEAFLEWRLNRAPASQPPKPELSCFLSYGYTDARYGQFRVITRKDNNQLEEISLKNRKVENAPEHIIRSGLTIGYGLFSLTGQWSAVSGSFADANNTYTPSANGQIGWIPAYQVLDLTLHIRCSKQWSIRSGMNNVTNSRYFTRRASGYPGPGLMPSDARSFFITLGFKG